MDRGGLQCQPATGPSAGRWRSGHFYYLSGLRQVCPMAVSVGIDASRERRAAQMGIPPVLANAGALGEIGRPAPRAGLRISDCCRRLLRYRPALVERPHAVEGADTPVVARSKIGSRDAHRLAQLRASSSPPHAMRPPRCASSEHKELLRDVHGSWARPLARLHRRRQPSRSRKSRPF